MRSLQILGVALVAVFSIGVVVVESASAVEFLLAEWLFNGTAVESELADEGSGEITLEDTKVPLLGRASVVCSHKRDGGYFADGAGTTTSLLTLAGGAVELTALTEPGLTCVNQLNCVEPLAWAVHLPWNTLAELMEDTTSFFVELSLNSGFGNPGFEINCMGTGGVTDECTSTELVDQLTNTGGSGVLGVFSLEFRLLAGAPAINCTLGGTEAGEVSGSEEDTATESEGSITISSM